jgi:hypothetical protein
MATPIRWTTKTFQRASFPLRFPTGGFEFIRRVLDEERSENLRSKYVLISGA